MLHKLFPKISALVLALAISCMTVLLIQSPTQAEELEVATDEKENLHGPEWIGPWYAEYIATRDPQRPIQAHPFYLTIPRFPAWTWVEGDASKRLTRIAPDGSVNHVGNGPTTDLTISKQGSGDQVVGIVTEYGGVMNAIDLIEMSEVGWMGRLINMSGFVPSMLHAGRAQYENIDTKVYSLVYDQVDRIYLAYMYNSPTNLPDEDKSDVIISSDDEKSLQLIDSSRSDLVKKIQVDLESNKKFRSDLQQWLAKHADVTKHIALSEILERKELDHPEILALLQENDLDFAIADTDGSLAPEVFLQEPVQQASWWRQPIDLELAMVEPISSAQPRTDLLLFSLIDTTWAGQPKKIVVTTQCQLRLDSYGYPNHQCADGYGFFPLHFAPTSQVSLMNSSSVPGWVRQAFVEQTSDNARVIIMKNEIMSDIMWFEPRVYAEYVGQGSISSASILSLSPTEYMLAVVENSELKIFLVNDQNSTPVFEPWPIPVSAAQSFKTVDFSREGDAMSLTAVTTNNQIWKFMANVPGTIWTP